MKGFFAQNLTLKLIANNKIETSVLEKLDYIKVHKDTTSINIEVHKISDYLKTLGYFTNTIHEIKKENKQYAAYFSLNNKIENAIIKIRSGFEIYLKNFKIKNNTIIIPIKNLQNTLHEISNNLDKIGASFSKVQLQNVTIKNKTLLADLDIIRSKKRIINNVIIRGYENFPKSYLKNYFNINDSSVFNQFMVTEIDEASKNLRFVSIIKPPEVLFTKDSTSLFLYFKKKQHNSFDGIVSFTSKENGKVLFNGNVDLKLNNLLNKGEQFELFWNSIGEERQELKLSSKTPYVFNSKFTPQISFSIYKQDSTFLNTKFDSKLFYNIAPRVKLAITYNSESSENLNKINSNNLETFNNHFLGLHLNYNIAKNDFFFNDLFSIAINPSFGKRKTNQENSSQFKLEISASYLWSINFRNSLFIKNSTSYLNSNNYLDNELFRVGGANSIRGFIEQSIFTSSFSYINMEYRFLTSQKSYLYSITDFGKFKTNQKNENLFSIGLGYLFTVRNAQINISTAMGKNSSQKFDFNKSRLSVSWINFF
tara:strand:- start:1036 stop:2649 length:1614 start_codon:yes stop_codon:yes gene_type:complete